MTEKANRLRPTQLHFYVNDQGFELIKAKMKQVGTDNMSSYLRKMAVDGYVIRLDMRELKELTRLLGNIAGSENQIAKRVNETGTVYAEDLEEIKKNQEQIRESVNIILRSLADLP
ncbi:MAG: plasmid mobilization relaxosome protein MobC [Clostridiales bacterium]|nr:plasmid mobilization relaxosome protein MobC [Clostridiales bacterium]